MTIDSLPATFVEPRNPFYRTPGWDPLGVAFRVFGDFNENVESNCRGKQEREEQSFPFWA